MPADAAARALGRADSSLRRAADRALRGRAGAPPWCLLALSAADVAGLANLAAAMASTGAVVPLLLAGVVFVARAPAAWARLRADMAASRRPPSPGRARAARDAEAGSRRGCLALLCAYAGLGLAASLAALAEGGAGGEGAFGLSASDLNAWTLSALPAATLAEALRLYAGCALGALTGSGRSRSGGAA